MKKFIITEEEKKNILAMYSVLTEQKMDVSKIIDKTYKLYLEPGNKSTKFEWDNPADSHPLPKNFLPTGKDYFEVKLKGLNYFSANTQGNSSVSANTQGNYSVISAGVNNNGEIYKITRMLTDSKMLEQSKFKVELNYVSPPSKSKWSTEVFYGYSDELRTDLNNNGIK